MRRSRLDIFGVLARETSCKKKNKTLNNSYQGYQSLNALVIKLLNSAYEHVNKKQRWNLI